MKFIFSLLFVFLCYSQSNQTDSIDQKIIFYSMNAEFEKALDLISEQKTKHPETPKYVFMSFVTKTKQISYNANSMNRKKRREYEVSENKKLFREAEADIEQFEDVPETIENKFYLGAMQGYFGLNVYKESLLKAFRYGLKGKNLLEEVIEEKPDYYDAYMGAGLFNYYAGRMANDGIVKWIAWLLGFSGDREKGLEQMRIAYTKGRLTKWEACIWLTDFYAGMEGSTEKALPFYREFIARHPNNRVMQKVYFSQLISLNNYGEIIALNLDERKEKLSPYSRYRFHKETGNYEETLVAAEDCLLEDWSDEDKEWMKIQFSYFAWVIDHEEKEKYLSELKADSQKQLKTLMGDKENAKFIQKFRRAVNDTQSTEEIEQLIAQKPTKLLGSFNDTYQYLLGLYYMRTNQFAEAEKVFLGDPLKRKWMAYEQLLNIYEKQIPGKKILESVIDHLEDLEYDALAIRAKDLQKRYH